MRGHNVVFALMFLKGACGAITEAVLGRDDMTGKAALMYQQRAEALKINTQKLHEKAGTQRKAGCEFEKVKVSTGLDVSQADVIATSTANIGPDRAKVVFKCAVGFTNDGTENGAGEVSAQCVFDGQQHKWSSLDPSSTVEGGSVVLGCMPIECDAIAADDSHSKVDWNPGKYTIEVGLTQYGVNEKTKAAVHGGVGTITCADGYSHNAKRIKQGNGWGRRERKVECYLGKLYEAGDVEKYGGFRRPTPDVNLVPLEDYELNCGQIVRAWPPTESPDKPGESILPLTEDWKENPVWLDWETRFCFATKASDSVDFFAEGLKSCCRGHSTTPAKPDDKFYNVKLDADGNYIITKNGLFDGKVYQDEQNLQADMKKLCQPIDCNPNPIELAGHRTSEGWIGAEFNYEANKKYTGQKVELKCTDGYSFTGKKDATQEERKKNIECDENGEWDGIEKCLSDNCESMDNSGEVTSGEDGVRTLKLTCPEGQSFTGLAEINDKGHCGTEANLCERALKCSNADGGWLTEQRKPCAPDDPADPCSCKPIKCPKPKLPKNSGTFSNMNLDMTDVKEGVAIYKNTIHMTCAVGYSFYGQKFKCGEEARIKNDHQCHASFVCKETSEFMRDKYCETVGQGVGGLVDQNSVLVNIPSGCERIKEYCPKLPPASGFQSDASCLHIAEGGEYEAECSYACDQVQKIIDYAKMTYQTLAEAGQKWNVQTAPRKCLMNSERLKCGHEGWTLNGEVQKVAEGEEKAMHDVMGNACIQKKNVPNCNVDAIWDLSDLAYERNADLRREIGSEHANSFVPQEWRQGPALVYCGDAVVLECLSGYVVADDPDTTLLMFECADTSDLVELGGKGLVVQEKMDFRRVSRHDGTLGSLWTGEWGCKKAGCGQVAEASWWKGSLVAGLYTVTWESDEAATLQCKSVFPVLKRNEQCFPPKSKNEWDYKNPGEVMIQCAEEGWAKPPESHIDACATQIKNKDGLALSVNDQDEVTWAKFDADDPKQRWARFDGNGASGLIVSASKPITFTGGTAEFTAKCLGITEDPVGVEKVAKCWCEHQAHPDDECADAFALKMVPCTHESHKSSGKLSHVWGLSSSTTEKTTCALSLIGPARKLLMSTAEDCYARRPGPAFFLSHSPKAATLTVNSKSGLAGANGKFSPDGGVPTLTFQKKNSE